MAANNLNGCSLTVRPRGALLLALRKDKTQGEVEKASGLPESRLYHYEKGRRISINHLKKLSAYYVIPARELVESESLQITLNLAKQLKEVFEFKPDELS